jgi:hypothetical protein
MQDYREHDQHLARHPASRLDPLFPKTCQVAVKWSRRGALIASIVEVSLLPK